MNISLTKLPWYGQIAAFVVLSIAGAGLYFYYYETPARAELASRQSQLKALRADVAKGQATERKLPQFRQQVEDLEHRLTDLSEVLPEEKDAADLLRDVHGIVVPGGFGWRGVEGKLEVVRHAREHGVPFLGLCLGLQCAVIEFARNVCGLEGANSSEFDPATPHPVIDLLPEQKDVTDLGGSMRLGAQPCHVVPGTRAERVYGEPVVYERHRHRYEVNPAYHEALSGKGMVFSGLSPDGRLVEIIELEDHPFFMAGQFHPELRSRPTRPHPLFRDFVGAAKAVAEEASPRTVVLPG